MSSNPIRGKGSPFFGRQDANIAPTFTRKPLDTNPTYSSKRFCETPRWAEKLRDTLKKIGLVAGAILCGALVLATLPIYFVGAGLMGFGMRRIDQANGDQKQKAIGRKMIVAGMVLGAPGVGFMACLHKLDRPEGDTFVDIKKHLS